MKKILSLFVLLLFINSYNQESVSPKEVIFQYIEAIGGKDKLESVESITMSGNFEIPQAPFKPLIVIKQQNPNLNSLELSTPEMGTIMKQKFNGENGYMEQMGQNVPFSEEQINSSKSKKGIFEELYYDSTILKIDGYINIGGSDLVKVKIDDKTIKYYDISSGLLARSEETTQIEGKPITTTRKFSDYKDIDGILYPFKTEIINGMQTITIEFDEIKFNEVFDKNDFN
tara:strand:+ start:1814 stop:2500 length:687 start_codon:yes stop_codon:yes gene_type:complete